jgi:hypothetical protein
VPSTRHQASSDTQTQYLPTTSLGMTLNNSFHHPFLTYIADKIVAVYAQIDQEEDLL